VYSQFHQEFAKAYPPASDRNRRAYERPGRGTRRPEGCAEARPTRWPPPPSGWTASAHAASWPERPVASASAGTRRRDASLCTSPSSNSSSRSPRSTVRRSARSPARRGRRPQPVARRGDGPRRRPHDRHYHRVAEELYFFTAGAAHDTRRRRPRRGGRDCVVIPPARSTPSSTPARSPSCCCAAARRRTRTRHRPGRGSGSQRVIAR